MPKLVLRDVHVTYLPNSAFGAPIQAYFLLSMEPPSLLWTWMTPKLRSGISQAFPMALATMNRADGGGPVPSEDAGDGDGDGDGEGPGDGASPRAPPPLARSRSENFGARSPSPRGGRASYGPGDASPGKRPSLLLRSASTFALKTLDSFQGRRRRGRAAPAPPTGAPPRYCASWHKDQFVLRLRLRDSASKYARGRHNAVDNASDSLAAALLVVSIWAHDPHYADSLVGVAQLAPAAVLNDSPHGAPAPFSQLVVLHGRAVAVLHGTLDLVTPDDASFRGAKRATRRLSKECAPLAFDQYATRASPLLRLSHGTLTKPMPRPSLRTAGDAALHAGPRVRSFRRLPPPPPPSPSESSLDAASPPSDGEPRGADADEDDGFPMIAASDAMAARARLPWKHTWTDAHFKWIDRLEPIVITKAIDEATQERPGVLRRLAISANDLMKRRYFYRSY